MAQTLTGVYGTYAGQCTGPSPGDLVTANSINVALQALLDDGAFHQGHFTGTAFDGHMLLTAIAASSKPGVDATGDGGAPGLKGTGGSGDGTGVIAIGGGTNGNGMQATAQGAGTGLVVAGGSTGEGIFCSAAGNWALHVSTGNMVLSGTAPVATADPGADGALSKANVCRAWGTLVSSGLTGTIVAGYGIASIQGVAAGPGYVEITWARAFSLATSYSVMVVSGDGLTAPYPDYTTSATNKIRIYFNKPDGSGTLDPTAVNYPFYVHAFGR